MRKSITVACFAIGAFAALVSAASASPVLQEAGIGLNPGTSVTAKNTGNFNFTGLFNATCTNAHLAGTVQINSGVEIKYEVLPAGATFSGTGAGTDCTSDKGDTKITLSKRWCFYTVKGTDSWLIEGCGEEFFIRVESTLMGACLYSAKQVTGSFTTKADATINVSKQPVGLVEGAVFCPQGGEIDLDFDLTTTNGTTLLIS